jgi:predicted tellurium resistance membrane protein TerC
VPPTQRARALFAGVAGALFSCSVFESVMIPFLLQP